MKSALLSTRQAQPGAISDEWHVFCIPMGGVEPMLDGIFGLTGGQARLAADSILGTRVAAALPIERSLHLLDKNQEISRVLGPR